MMSPAATKWSLIRPNLLYEQCCLELLWRIGMKKVEQNNVVWNSFGALAWRVSFRTIMFGTNLAHWHEDSLSEQCCLELIWHISMKKFSQKNAVWISFGTLTWKSVSEHCCLKLIWHLAWRKSNRTVPFVTHFAHWYVESLTEQCRLELICYNGTKKV